MKKYLLLFVLLALFHIIPNNTQAQFYKPVLISPSDSAIFQKTKNLELKWEPRLDIDIYICQYALDKKFQNLQGDYLVSGNNLFVFDLLYDSVYYWRVKLSTDTVWSDTWSFRTTGKPVKPILYAPKNNLNNQSDSLDFFWNYNAVNQNYLLQISTDSLFLKLFSTTSTKDTTAYINNLKFGTKYYWRVRGLNVDFTGSDWSDVFNFKTRLATPSLFNPVDNVRNIDTVLAFTWTPVDSAKFYNFQLALSSEFHQDSILLEKKLIVTNLILDSLKTGTTMYWRIKAETDSADTSYWSDVYSFRTRLSIPKLLSPKDSLINQDTVLTFTWNKINSADNYKLLIAEDNNFTILFLDQNLKTTKLKVDSLQHFKKYFWKVLATNKNKDSSYWSDTSFIKTRLTKPYLLSPKDSLKNIPLNQVLSWTVIPGATSYNLQLSESPAFIEPLLDTVINRTTFRPTILNFDSLYYWRVTAFNNDNDSSLWAAFHRFKTRPSILIIQDSIKKSANLSLNASDTLGIISVSNAGINQYIIDSIKIKPDSVFFLSQKKAVIQPNSVSDFLLRFKTLKADTGLNSASLYLIRSTSSFGKDTLKADLLLTVKKAKGRVSSDSLIYDNTPPERISKKLLTISNKGGNIPLSINKIFITSADSNSYKLVNPPKSIKPNDSISFYIEFKPEDPGILQSEVQVQTNSYPMKIFNVLLKGKGVGGKLASESISAINKAVKDTMETFTNNNKKIFFKNVGNDWLNVNIRFPKNWFKVTNDFQNYFSLKPNDTVTVGIKYLTPNFNKVNFDTLSIIHNGFGDDTTKLLIAGSFDSLQSALKLKNNIRFNSEPFVSTTKILEVETPVNMTLNPSLFSFQNNLEFRLGYYLGGPGKKHLVYNDGNYNFNVPKHDITKNGLVISGELITKNSLGKIIDSIAVFDSTDIQTIIPKLKTVDILVPRSIPAEDKKNAKAKWILFGFPYEEIIADTVFKYFGGMKNMKDGEWIVYKYDPAVKDSFSLFNDYYFKETTTYFAAQSLLDTFQISYTYPQNTRSRKLTNNEINYTSNGWKTVSSPFLFDVQVDTTLMLRKYDTNTKSYKMTNIMKPGEGYFVEPEVKKIKMLTFGKYNPLYYPKALADNGWFVKLIVSDEASSSELYFTVINSNSKLSKNVNLKNDYVIPPKLQNGLEAYITNEESTNKFDVSIKQGEGALWNFVVANEIENSSVKINPELFGDLPKDYKYVIYDPENKKVYEPKEIEFVISRKHSFKLIIGTEKFITDALLNIRNDIPKEFYLAQNYPNPFNPVTTIKYSIPALPTGQAGSLNPSQGGTLVTLKLFDVLGREVGTLVNEIKQPGTFYYTLSIINYSLSSGIYFYQLKAGNYSSVKKMILLK